TKKLNITYLKILNPGKHIIVKSVIKKIENQDIYVEGEIFDKNRPNKIIAKAKAIMEEQEI
ncbi:MAG: hypothetical protein AABX80_00870, partial [Nanoarchaeota archaeon]